MNEATFKNLVRHDGKQLFRTMPWREPMPDDMYDPYPILVSEVMLQQTQVPRVIVKFADFIEAFPTLKQLADASLADVLKLWSGLGYNRRAKYLHDAAKQLANAPEPWGYEELVACKGIGPNTAKAVLVYAYDQPEVFIETNIRTVFIHYFFKDKPMVTDKDILELHTKLLNKRNPRAYYWALMDIGASLKATEGNASKNSQSYKKQSRFSGSLREIRGAVLKKLADGQKSFEELDIPDERLPTVLKQLDAEGLIHKYLSCYRLGNG